MTRSSQNHFQNHGQGINHGLPWPALGAANAYLGLFAGMTVSAAIPAAVVSMGVLPLLQEQQRLNNIVQTTASAGEPTEVFIFTLSPWSSWAAGKTSAAKPCGSQSSRLGGILGVL